MANFSLLKQKLSGDDDLDKITAQQEAQQSNVLPTERQPPMMPLADPKDEALQTPAISPEDIIAGGLPGAVEGVASKLGRAAAPYAEEGAAALAQASKPVFQGIKDLVGNEVGGVALQKGALNPTVQDIASEYAKSKGLLPPRLVGQPKADPNRGALIAQAYDLLKHDPSNPEVQKAYDALIKETQDQYQMLKKAGLKVSKITPDMPNPYPNGSKDVFNDINTNNHLYYYPTDSGFGSGEKTLEHPLLQDTSEEINGEKLKANDLFRIVHDYFGHAKEGNGFGPNGEEAAWQLHRQMYSPEAQKALTTETRGQNSWVNFGPHGEANRANPAMTKYADQKAGILPDWVNDVEGLPQSGKNFDLIKRQLTGILPTEQSAIQKMNETANSAIDGSDPMVALNRLLSKEQTSPTMEDVAKSQQAASRSIDMADRYRKQALRKKSGL